MSDPLKPTALWAYEEKLSGWAYGINSQRIASRISGFRHYFGEAKRRSSSFDLKLSFDILTHIRTKHVKARAHILRVGGPSPLTKLDRTALKQAFADVAVVIALSPELQKAVREYHSNVVFILNGVDLSTWSRHSLSPLPTARPFRAGMAASLKTAAQREVKGYEIARRACELTGTELLVVGRGINQLPHDQMIREFYSQIDVLIHPVGPGKEASSNVIMESLALGIPVVTTRHAGYHGQALANAVNALIVPREVDRFAEALTLLRDDADLRNKLAAAGRLFAEAHHDLDAVAREYENLFRSALAMTEETSQAGAAGSVTVPPTQQEA